MPLFSRISLFNLLLLFIFRTAAPAQDTAAAAPAADSVHKDLRSRLLEAGALEMRQSTGKYRESQVLSRQNEILDAVKKTMEGAKIYMKSGIDTPAIARELEHAHQSLDVVSDGVFTNKGSSQTQRNLTVSAAILKELHTRMTHRQQLLNRYALDLRNYVSRLDSLSSDSALFHFPTDSASLMLYLRRLAVVAQEVNPTENKLKKAINNVQELQLKVDPMVFELRSAIEDVEIYRQDLSGKIFSREFNNIWGPVYYTRPFGDILRFSIAKERLALSFYIEDNLPRFFIVLALLVVCYLFIRSLRRKILLDGVADPELKDQLIIRYPFLSATLITFSIFQFLLPSPPFIVNALFWLIPAVFLCFIFHRFISGYWMLFWVVMILFFVLAAADNLVLQASRTERFLMLGMSVAGVIFTLFFLLGKRRQELKERGILYFITFVTVMEIISILFNVSGRYNLAKTFLVSGFTGLVIAILFLWTVRLINEGLRLANKVYQYPVSQRFRLNFQRIGTEVPVIFYVLLTLGWLILVGRNFYGFKLFVDPFADFLSRDRTLGQYDFSINSLLLFVLILVCSVLLSRLISFFVSEPSNAHNAPKAGKIGLGSWILLVRIFIICLGLFLAFAATGIPIDRITIIVGALGVGVGLGLQGLVTNLVSGIIIAFEKPVNVGDIIEFNGHIGTMKSIGFRSSIVTSIDGAHIIIPNGELLNQHLTNWTMGKNVKRVILQVGVAYGTDLERVKNIMTSIITDDERILPIPSPLVVARTFGDSAVNFEVIYWVRNIKEHLVVTSDVITRVSKAFKLEGIVIPFPQQDLYIRKMPDSPDAQE